MASLTVRRLITARTCSRRSTCVSVCLKWFSNAFLRSGEVAPFAIFANALRQRVHLLTVEVCLATSLLQTICPNHERSILISFRGKWKTPSPLRRQWRSNGVSKMDGYFLREAETVSSSSAPSSAAGLTKFSANSVRFSSAAISSSRVSCRRSAASFCPQSVAQV